MKHEGKQHIVELIFTHSNTLGLKEIKDAMTVPDLQIVSGQGARLYLAAPPHQGTRRIMINHQCFTWRLKEIFFILVYEQIVYKLFVIHKLKGPNIYFIIE